LAKQEHSTCSPPAAEKVGPEQGFTLRRLILFMVLAALAYPAGAGTRVTVAQLNQALNAAFTAHKPDAEIARQIASMELSEQLTEASLERLYARLAPGAQTAQAIALLADRSAFLDPPVAELPGTAAPDGAAQQRMLDAARNYVAQTLPRLPDFLATRTINRYDDSPQALKKGAWPVRAGLHLVGTSSREISVRNEREGQAVKQGSAASQEQSGLSSWGEFGFLPALIVTDTVKGKVTWNHWEQMAAGVAAVFHYAVPRSASHYEIIETVPHGPRVPFLGQYANASAVRTTPAYRGSLWVDPATGIILRISIEIDENGSDQFRRVAVMVQYGPVRIGDRTFICPARSLTLELGISDVNSSLRESPTEWLNIASYSGYHRFAATARILADTPKTQPRKPDSASESPQATSPEPNETASAIEKTTLPQSGLPSSSSYLDSPTESTPTVPAPEAPAPRVVPPIEPTPAASDARADEPLTNGIALKVNVNRVLVPVVVRDKQGRSVSDLKKDDFQLFDNNKPGRITSFTVERRGTAEVSAASSDSVTQSPAPAHAAEQPSSLPQRTVVLLFDDLHLSIVDLANAKKAAEKALDGILGSSNQVAVVSLSGKAASGLTRDRVKLQESILSLKSQGDYLHVGEVCPKIGYLQAWLIEFPQEAGPIGEAAMQIVACGASSDLHDAERTARLTATRIVQVVGRDYVESFSAIDEVVRRMAALPGQRTLILISPGFALRAPEVSAAESQMINLAAQSNVTISTLSARGLYTTSVSAGNDNSNRYSILEVHAEESALSDLADGTGGTFFHNSNDLEAGFKALAEGPEPVYLLELSLGSVKPDGAFHRLKIKVNRDGVQAQARHGYFMPKPEKAKD
jgi:VWFA-related protein